MGMIQSDCEEFVIDTDTAWSKSESFEEALENASKHSSRGLDDGHEITVNIFEVTGFEDLRSGRGQKPTVYADEVHKQYHFKVDAGTFQGLGDNSYYEEDADERQEYLERLVGMAVRARSESE